MNINNRQSNKQVFFSLEFVNLLLQMEAKPVTKSAVIANPRPPAQQTGALPTEQTRRRLTSGLLKTTYISYYSKKQIYKYV